MFYCKELEFFQRIAESFRINTTIIKNNEIPSNIDLGIRRDLHLTEDLYALFNKNLKLLSSSDIIKFTDDIFCSYILIALPESDGNTLVVGPYTKDIVNKEFLLSVNNAAPLTPHTERIIERYFTLVPYMRDDTHLINIVNCFGETIHKNSQNFKFSVITQEIHNDSPVFSRGIYSEKREGENINIEFIEQVYDSENKLLDAVSQGHLHKAESLFGEMTPSKAIESRIADPLRNCKNFMIVFNTLLRKAAEKGGVHPVYIDNVSSDFALKIESLPNLDEVDKLFPYMIKKYCRLVNAHTQKNYSLLIQKVVTHIDTDVTADIGLKELAKHFNVNASYLSSLFKKETGCNITDYICRKRIERAQLLLTKTSMQIQHIAQNCGILDVNYFTKLFKKYSGMTPKAYRAEFRQN